MYLNPKDIKALKILIESNSRNVRTTGRKQRAISQLNRSLIQNDRRIQKQRKMINKAMQVPTTKKNNNPWD